MLIFNKLSVIKLLAAIVLLMRNFLAYFLRILGICKDFAANRVNEYGNIPQCGVVSQISDFEVVALGIMEAFGIDSETLLFHRLHHEYKEDFHTVYQLYESSSYRLKICANLIQSTRYPSIRLS